MRFIYKILVRLLNKDWRWEEGRAWLDYDNIKRDEGFWYLVVHIYHKNYNPKTGIQIDCGGHISRWQCFKFLLKAKDKVCPPQKNV